MTVKTYNLRCYMKYRKNGHTIIKGYQHFHEVTKLVHEKCYGIDYMNCRFEN